MKAQIYFLFGTIAMVLFVVVSRIPSINHNLFYGVSVSLISVPVFLIQCRSIIKELRTFWWPWTDGQIVSSQISQKGYGRRTTFKFLVKYTYMIDGITYVSERSRLHDFGSNWEMGYTALARRFPEKSRAEVYYNPRNFSEAVLIRGFNAFTFALFLLAALGLYVGIQMLRIENIIHW